MYDPTFLHNMTHEDLNRVLMLDHDQETEIQVESEVVRRKYDIEHDITYC
tara:strand:+ start:592 stop:741 length:150 start_codon:yes stop_codon:yes gene_type:complete